jgi:hypothetical protein
MSERLEHARAMVREIGASAIGQANLEDLEPFIDGMAADLDAAWTVPAERQDEFFDEMRVQALALPELGRLRLLNVTRTAFVASIIAAMRFAVRVAVRVPL